MRSNKNTLLVRNGRIYTPTEVIINHTICCEGGRISRIVPDSEISDTDVVINAGNVIVAPGFINICANLSWLQHAETNRLTPVLNQLQRDLFTSGTTAFCPIISLSGAQKFIHQVEKGKLNREKAARLIGYRLNYHRSEYNQDSLHMLTDLLKWAREEQHRILDIRIKEGDNDLIQHIVKHKDTMSLRICVEIESAEHLLAIDCSAVDCLSVSAELVPEVRGVEKWIELRLPTSTDYLYGKSVVDVDFDHERLLVGNHWSPSNATKYDWAPLSFKHRMFYTSVGEFEFMNQNQAIRYLNSQLGIPLNQAIRISTMNPCTYLGISDQGTIKAGSPLEIVIVDSKLNVRQVIALDTDRA